MAFVAKVSLPKLDKETERSLTQQFRQIAAELSDLATPPHTITPLVTDDYTAQIGQLVRAVPRAAGFRLLLPPALPNNQTNTVLVAVESVASGGSVTVAVVGRQTIDGAFTKTLSTVGVTYFVSLGDKWGSISGGGGVTPPIPLTSLQTIPDETFVGNVSGGVATPSAINLSSLAGTGLSWNSALNRLDASAGSALTLLTTEVNLGSKPTYSGSFTIAGVGLTIGKPVLIQQAVGPYTGKGTLADEAEDQVSVTASVTSAVLITAYWQAVASPIMGNVKFNYAVSA